MRAPTNRARADHGSLEHGGVAVVDFTGHERHPRLDKFITGRDDVGERFCINRHLGDPLGGKKSDLRRRQHFTTTQEDLSGADISAADADVFPSFDALAHGDEIALALDILLHDDRISPGRDDRSGENANGLAGFEVQPEIPARGLSTFLHTQARSDPRLGGSHGVAVHARVVEGR